MKPFFDYIPNWHFFKIVKQYAVAEKKRCLTLEDFEAALYNYLSFAINKN